MSTSFDIRCSQGSYSVRIEAGLVNSALEQAGNDIVMADEWFNSILAVSGRRSIPIPAFETTKSLDAIPELMVELRRQGANRQTELIALGGGIVQDIVAFIASVYMRGLSWTYLPSTLLSMTDSCIGGKSSINVGPYKNLVGTFHPPKAVLIDPKLTLTLNDEQRVSGLVEAAKICYCRGGSTFREYLALDPGPSMPVDRVEQVIIGSLLAKKWFIEVDEFDKSERLLLNFGHTFGHALEGASHFGISHGIGVAVGILCAIELGRLLDRTYATADVKLLEDHLRQLLTGVPSLAADLRTISIPDILDRFQADKKHRNDAYSVILIGESGGVEIARLPRGEDSLCAVQIALKNTIGSLIGPVPEGHVTNEIQ